MTAPMGPELIETWKRRIDAMTQDQCAARYRFAPVGDPVFSTPELWAYFQAHFAALGGMTPEISQRIGWGHG